MEGEILNNNSNNNGKGSMIGAIIIIIILIAGAIYLFANQPQSLPPEITPETEPGLPLETPDIMLDGTLELEGSPASDLLQEVEPPYREPLSEEDLAELDLPPDDNRNELIP